MVAARDGTVLSSQGHAQRLHSVLGGGLRVMSFMYTYCRDAEGCPLARAAMEGLHPALLREPDLATASQLVSLSFDPTNDTPHQMRMHGGERIGDPRLAWRFITTASVSALMPLLRGLGQDVTDSLQQWRYGGQAGSLNALEQRGLALFVDRGCIACHPIGERSALLTDGEFHSVGVRARSEALGVRDFSVTLVRGLQATLSQQALHRIGVLDAPDRGRQEVTGRARDLRAYRTPSLRNVALTAPYMHDGSFATLEEVLD